MAARTILTAAVASGDTASAAFAMAGKRAMAKSMIFFPSSLTSCQAFLEASVLTNPTSADFYRVHSPTGSGQFVAYPGVGPMAMTIEGLMAAAVTGRVVLSVVQSASRTLTLASEA